MTHSDDLTASVPGLTTALPEEATDIVLTLLTRLAARRLGATAVLRAYTRRERAPELVAIF